jgi:hypothetical protein
MLSGDINLLRQRIDLLLREYPDLVEDDVLRLDMIEGETDFSKIMTRLVRLVQDAKALQDGTTERLNELSQRKKRFEHRVDAFRDLIRLLMETAGTKKLELPEATLSMRAGIPSLVGDPDPNELPDTLVKIERKPDRTKIREALERGDLIPGCALSNSPPSLTLRVK